MLRSLARAIAELGAASLGDRAHGSSGRVSSVSGGGGPWAALPIPAGISLTGALIAFIGLVWGHGTDEPHRGTVVGTKWGYF